MKRAVLLFAAIAGAFALGIASHRYVPRALDWVRSETPDDPELSAPAGYWRLGRAPRTGSPHTELTEEEQERLLAVPYLQGSKPASGDAGVTRYDRKRVDDGFNLIVSGHGTEAVLTDMEGKVLHRWALDFETVRKRLPDPPPRIFWRRARLLPGGDLLAVYEYLGLVRIDSKSRLRWSLRRRAHHDVDVDDQGNVYTLTQHPRVNPLSPDRSVIADDRITILTPEGRLLEELSVLDCLLNSHYAAALDAVPASGDVLHTNTVTVFDGSQAFRSELFRKGNLLISLRQLNLVAIVDRQRRSVVWALSGLWRTQHEPVLLENGHMLVFDNLAAEEQSRVLELDPFSQQIVWQYRGTEDEPFYSDIGGSNQRLANGNTLIIESVFGRAFEVTPTGEIVWEYVNPYRAGEDDELIATLFDVVRIPKDSPLVDFLDLSDDSGGT